MRTFPLHEPHQEIANGDFLVASLGITKQADGLRYEDVDYAANLALLREAERAGLGAKASFEAHGAAAVSEARSLWLNAR